MIERTTCTLDCPGCCQLLVRPHENGGLRLVPDPEHPFTRGLACAKGMGFPRRLASPDRVTTPLMRRAKGDPLVPVSWDEALARCAGEISRLRNDPRAMLHLHGHGYRGAAAEASRLFFRTLGASATHGSLCDENGIAAQILDFGSLKQNNPEDLANAEAVVTWGKDLTRSSLHVARLVKEAKADGARVLAVTPGSRGDDHLADDVLRLRPGTDRFLAAAAVRLLLEGPDIPEAVSSRTANFNAFREMILGLDMESLLQAAGCTIGDARRLLRWYQRPESVATLLGWGLQRHQHGGESVRMIDALALLTGHVGRAGGGVAMSVPSSRNFNYDFVRTGEPSRLFSLPRIGREILRADPAVEMIWVDGINVVNQAPDSGTVARALESVPFVVVVDAFMNDTAVRADLFLPCTLQFEREDIVGSYQHDFVNHSARICDPPGQARSDDEILRDLGRRLEPVVDVPEREEMLHAALDSPRLSTSLEQLRETGWAGGKHPAVAFEDMLFDHPDGRFRFLERISPPLKPDSDYPLTLLSLVRGDAIHSQIPEELQQMPPEVYISPDCPVLETIDTERDTFLVTPLGRMAVRVRTMPGLQPEVVIYRRGDWMKLGGGVNRLIQDRTTDMAEGAAFYSQGCRLESAS